ncbi:MAG: hypothetical protein LBD67_05375 [Candidatus Accumulibacter sp.]|jgi:hypothetical protein|nr:hypothetical protein [Accumulibacter sp.]
MRKVFFDNNMLSSAFNPKKDDATDRRRREIVKALLSDPEVLPVITPLVRFEFLCGCGEGRGVCCELPNELETALAKLEDEIAVFDEILVREKEVRWAAELFYLYKDRYQIKDEKINRYKRAFDFLYCACADINNLETVSDDGHIKNIQELMQEHPPNRFKAAMTCQNAQTFKPS